MSETAAFSDGYSGLEVIRALVDPHSRECSGPDAVYVLKILDRMGEIALLFVSSRHSRNPQSTEALVLAGAFREFAQSAPEPRLAVHENHVIQACWPAAAL